MAEKEKFIRHNIVLVGRRSVTQSDVNQGSFTLQQIVGTAQIKMTNVLTKLTWISPSTCPFSDMLIL